MAKKRRALLMPERGVPGEQVPLASAWWDTSTRWGWVRVWATPEGLGRVECPSPRPPDAPGELPEHAALEIARCAGDQIAQYLAGRRRDLPIPLDWRGASEFSRQVLTRCREIPYGSTVTYRQLAQALGRPGAARAVGQALAANRWPLVVPCHRVVPSDGAVGGFAFGTEVKRRLLELERRASPPPHAVLQGDQREPYSAGGGGSSADTPAARRACWIVSEVSRQGQRCGVHPSSSLELQWHPCRLVGTPGWAVPRQRSLRGQ